METSFLTQEEVEKIGLKSIGENVLISRKASFYFPEEISLGNNVRIDDFCLLSGNIKLGNNIHVSAYAALYGALGIEVDDDSNISSRVNIYSAMDDCSGEYYAGPMHPKEKINVTGGLVIIEKYVQIGVGSVIFPNLTIKTGSVVGAMSFVNRSLDEWGIYIGIPAKKLKDRKRNFLLL